MRRVNWISRAALFVVSLLLTPHAAWAQRIQPDLWEYTIT